MTKSDTSDRALRELIGADLRDSLDEELELEFGESQLEQFGDLQSTREAREPLNIQHTVRVTRRSFIRGIPSSG